MKTSEFKKRVEELGYSVINSKYTIYVNKDEILLAIIEKGRQYKLETYNLTAEQNAEELLDLCVEYAKTPINEREEEEKFYLKKMKSFYNEDYDEEYAYLNVFTKSEYFMLNNSKQGNCYKTQFTQKEIDKIKEEQHTDLSEFKQIPVESVNIYE